jgi:hypothetical protein
MAMDTTAIFRFETYHDAVYARDAVFHRHGADLNDAWLDLRDDEAGPAQGNFVTELNRSAGWTADATDRPYRDTCVTPVLVIADCRDTEGVRRVTEFLATLGGQEMGSPVGH